MSKDIKKILVKFLKEKRAKVYLTGHSKGGSLASLYALEMSQDKDLPSPEYVCSFGAARVGDVSFAKYFNGLVHQTTYENNLDIIPFLPPSSKDKTMKAHIEDMIGSDDDKSIKNERYTWDYSPIGQRKYI